MFSPINIALHCFPDDLLIYMPIKVQQPHLCPPVFFHLNKNKTEIFFFKKKKKEKVFLDVSTSLCHPFTRNLDVKFDSAARLSKEISKRSKRSFYFQLRLRGRVKVYLAPHNFERVIHAVVTGKKQHDHVSPVLASLY